MTMDDADYCRRLETYLCRKNEGHLIRIVGPAFEKVCGWATMGVPFKVACRGIDRACARYYAAGPRRRPVRIEFCEADVLEEFDRWRRAVGVAATERAGAPAGDAPGASRTSLPRHLDRVLAKLTAVRAARALSPGFAARVDAVIDEVERLRAGGTARRGAARAAAIARLAALDRALLDAAREDLGAEREALTREAVGELEPFRARMAPGAWASSVEAAVDRLIRERLGLPSLEQT